MISEFKRLHAYFYRSKTGKEPVRDWLKDLSRKDRHVIGLDLKTIEYGWPLGMPVCRPLGQGLYEVRSRLEDGRITRIFFVIRGNSMVLLHGFVKKSQKTPDKEMGIAISRKKEVMENE